MVICGTVVGSVVLVLIGLIFAILIYKRRNWQSSQKENNNEGSAKVNSDKQQTEQQTQKMDQNSEANQ